MSISSILSTSFLILRLKMSTSSRSSFMFLAALTLPSLALCQTPTPFQYGFVLPNSGVKIVHGNGALVRNAFPPEENIPGQQHVFTPGNTVDPTIPTFSGGTGFSEFDVNYRPPRHVHLAPKSHGTGQRFVAEKIYVIGRVAGRSRFSRKDSNKFDMFRACSLLVPGTSLFHYSKTCISATEVSKNNN